MERISLNARSSIYISRVLFSNTYLVQILFHVCVFYVCVMDISEQYFLLNQIIIDFGLLFISFPLKRAWIVKK